MPEIWPHRNKYVRLYTVHCSCRHSYFKRPIQDIKYFVSFAMILFWSFLIHTEYTIFHIISINHAVVWNSVELSPLNDVIYLMEKPFLFILGKVFLGSRCFREVRHQEIICSVQSTQLSPSCQRLPCIWGWSANRKRTDLSHRPSCGWGTHSEYN